MQTRIITDSLIKEFEQYLLKEEKSEITINGTTYNGQ